ncbi:ammonium transporter, Amt family [Methylomarinovum caldicuralii]|uniref:Ammonium transporter, Amt family n=1 Tax=Methylomarinovum caldicuralii TaxID=438856 RepID=A0AAU9C164_9GAMM|nr:EAL domain-containing protein [Methylomarinovum caldicuralii]BCX81313.1 ammonium transporter, Amt family [Methylomarinovum caldicuralii]
MRSRIRSGFSLPFVLFLALSAAVIGVGFAAGQIAARLDREQLQAELARHSDSTLSLLSASLLEPLLSEDIPVIRTVVERVARADPDLCEIVVRNADGDVLVRWSRSGPHDEQLHFSGPVAFDGERLGEISLAWTSERIRQQLEARTVRVWLATTVPLAALLFLVLAIVHWLAVRPLRRICRHAEAFSRGEGSSRLPPKGSRELRLLTETVNRTLELMAQSRRQQAALEKALDEAHAAKELAEVTLHSIGDAVITTDRYGRVTYLNPVAEKLTGWRRDEAVGLSIREVFFIVDGESGERIENDPVSRALEADDVVLLEGYVKLNARDGQQYVIEDSAAPIRTREGVVLGAVLVFHDVTEQQHMREEMNYQATHDPLTGLLNRRAFEQKLRDLVEDFECKEHALLYLDLDQFKVVNDTCGHAAGDALLKQLTAVMQARLRRSDILARLGGDEFAIILPCCPFEQALACAEKLRQAVQDFRFPWQGNTFAVGVSIGLVPFRGAEQNPADVLSAADQACFAAKDAGRNRVHVYQPDDRELVQRCQEMHWVARIHRALERDDFALYVQPIVPVRGEGEGDHYEILLRMYTEDGKLVPPGAFLPAAERYDLIGLVDRWVIEAYLAWLGENPAHQEDLALASINISGTSVSDTHFLDFILRQVKASGIDPSKLCFEITETVAIANIEHARCMIAALSDLGCCFALDDFGTGMSSFGYLKHMPVDFLKIDGSFIKDLVRDPIDYALVKTINEVGHIMGKRTIAEFVEDDEILQRLREIGVDFAQGYGIGKPQPLEEWVAARRTRP